jgi:hypothetical protein
MQRGERKRKTNRREVYERNEELQTRKTRELRLTKGKTNRREDNKREDKQKEKQAEGKTNRGDG